MITVEVDTTAPQVAILLNRNPVNVGSLVDIRVSAIDNVGVASLSLTLDGVPLALDANRIARVPMNTVGSFTALATATDAAGNTATNTIQVFVADPNDVQGPTLSITSPGDGGTITAPTDVIGSVVDDTLVSYRLLLAEFGTSTFKVIGTGVENVANGVLGQIDPTLQQNGSYILRLEAFDASGNGSILEQTVEVTGELKLGNFRISFTDMVVPVGGIPIDVTRIYDTLESDSVGDFGFGWRLEYRDTDLRVGLPDSGLEEFGIYNPIREGVKVYLNVPGEGRQGFTFTPEIRLLPGLGNSLVLARPKFTPDTGVRSTLSAGTSGYLQVNEYGELYAAGGVPYHPASPDFGNGWTLTTQDGTIFRIDSATGQLTSATDLDGNRVTYDDSGIYSSRGESIQFERDPQGRVTAIVDPQGNRVQYEYSAAGDLSRTINRVGNSNEFKYEASQPHFLTSVVDGRGVRIMEVDFDPVTGRMVGITGPTGRSDVDYPLIVPELGPGLYAQRVDDVLGRPSEVVMDRRGNVVRRMELARTAVDSNQSIWRVSVFEYDDSDNQVAVYAPFDAIGLARYTDLPTSRLSGRSFNGIGYVLQEIDALGNVTRYTYDRSGNELTETDALGNTVTNQYDNRRMLTSTKDQFGNVTRIVANASGDVTDIVKELKNGQTVSIQDLNYDGFGLLTSAVSTSGLTHNFVNENSGDLTLLYYYWEDPQDADQEIDNTVVTRNLYDANDRVIRTRRYTLDGKVDLVSAEDLDAIVPDSDVVTNYDGDDRITGSTDRFNRTTQYVYDASGNMIEVRIPSVDNSGAGRVETERITRTIFDALGRIVFATDAFDPSSDREIRATQYFYDELDRQVESRRIRNLETELRADPNNLGQYETVVTNLDSLETLWFETAEYDTQDRVVETRSPTGLITQFAYDAVGRQISETYFVDLNQNGVIDVPAEALVSTFEYDAVGNQIRTTGPTGTSVERVFDAAGREINRILPSGATFETIYDERHRVVETVDELGRITNYEYDDADNLTLTILPELSDGTRPTYEYQYDIRGNRTAVIDPNGHETRYQFDEANRRVASTLPLGLQNDQFTETVQYDVQTGQPISAVNYQDIRAEFEYDNTAAGGGSLIGTAYYETSQSAVPSISVGLRFNALGWLSRVDDSESGVTAYSYDADGRLLQVQDPSGTTVYEYDQFGNQTAIETELTRLEYQYDELNRLTSASTVKRNGIALTLIETSTYRYERSGALDLQIQPNGILSDYSYDEFDRLESLVHYYPDGTPGDLSDNEVVASYHYTVDASGTWIELTESRDGDLAGVNDDLVTTYEWEYDALSRLIREDIQGFDASGAGIHQRKSYVLDGAGNRLQTTLDIGVDGSVDRQTTTTYDANNRILTELTTDSVAGSNEFTVHSYEGTLPTSRTTYLGGNETAPVGKTVEYKYDVRERLIEVSITEEGTNETFDFEYNSDGDRVRQTVTKDGQQLITTYRIVDMNPTGYSQVIEQTTSDGVRTFSIAIDVATQADAAGETITLIYDPHGSTRLLTTPDAQIIEAFMYDAFGNPLGFNAELAGTTLLYNGEQTDGTGMQFLRARYYDPAQGRLLTPDPVEARPGQLHTHNQYQFAGNSPTMRIDPSGGVDFTLIGQQVAQQIQNGLKKRETIEKGKAFFRAAKKIVTASYGINLAYALADDEDTRDVALVASAYHIAFARKFHKVTTLESFRIKKISTLLRTFTGSAKVGKEVPLKATGFPDYRNFLFPGKIGFGLREKLFHAVASKVGLNAAQLIRFRSRIFMPLLGTRRQDKKLAGAISFLGPGSAATFTWHHHEVIGIMEAVKFKHHQSRGHSGGVLYFQLALGPAAPKSASYEKESSR